ncbi:MAG: hypothetical protein IJ833_04410 [Lachnospiraceae bacterium]|nr:hypothetical protein [Lachnospiraceae bacterium]
MSDFGKLFKRDRLYWLIMTVILLGVTAHIVVNGWGKFLKDTMEHAQYIQAMWEEHPEYRDMIGDLTEGVKVSLDFQFYGFEILWGMVKAVFLVQVLKVLTQETRNRTEVQSIFPVKARSILTYHYISGLLLITIPTLLQSCLGWLRMLYVEKHSDIIFEEMEMSWCYTAQIILLFMLHYALLICCRKLTNHVPATVFTFAVLELAMVVGMEYLFRDIDIDHIRNVSIRNGVSLVILTAVLILLSYITEQKKDVARNGFYVFPAVHWFMMGIVFIELCWMVHGVYENIHKVVGMMFTLVLSLAITAGIHFVVRPKRI